MAPGMAVDTRRQSADRASVTQTGVWVQKDIQHVGTQPNPWSRGDQGSGTKSHSRNRLQTQARAAHVGTNSRERTGTPGKLAAPRLGEQRGRLRGGCPPPCGSARTRTCSAGWGQGLYRPGTLRRTRGLISAAWLSCWSHHGVGLLTASGWLGVWGWSSRGTVCEPRGHQISLLRRHVSAGSSKGESPRPLGPRAGAEVGPERPGMCGAREGRGVRDGKTGPSWSPGQNVVH